MGKQLTWGIAWNRRSATYCQRAVLQRALHSCSASVLSCSTNGCTCTPSKHSADARTGKGNGGGKSTGATALPTWVVTSTASANQKRQLMVPQHIISINCTVGHLDPWHADIPFPQSVTLAVRLTAKYGMAGWVEGPRLEVIHQHQQYHCSMWT